MKNKETEMIHGAESYFFKNDCVRLHITKTCGMMAPVYFNLGNDRWVQPYSIAPWKADGVQEKSLPAVLRNLRGDFFSLPFGENPEVSELIHGESANLDWKLKDKTQDGLLLSLTYNGVTLLKEIKSKGTSLYIKHTIEGLVGDFTYGHHAILHFPEEIKAQIVTSSFTYGSVIPYPFNNNSALGEKSTLETAYEFQSLKKIKTKEGKLVSLEYYPVLNGSEDLFMISKTPSQLAWTAVIFPNYIWVSIKQTSDFPSTLFWVTNGGRNSIPWRGQHNRRLGIEEINGYFDRSVKEAKKHSISNNISCYKSFDKKKVSLKNIQLVIPIDIDFGNLKEIVLDREYGKIIAYNQKGIIKTMNIDLKFFDAPV